MKDITRNSGCRICNGKQLVRIFRFGPQPPANAFLKKTQLKKKESYYPLDVYFCKSCYLVQLLDIVAPEILFKDYTYVSSTSAVFIKHFEEFADVMVKRLNLTKKSLVIDIGSNDGILLKPYLKKGIQVLGIEPAENVAKIARKEGIDTISEFFNLKMVEKIKKKYGLANLITATNVFAHINDINLVTEGVNDLLSDDGVFIIEAPYLIDFISKNLFDTVYHEHLSYFSVTPLITFFKKHNMRVYDVERVSTHGGSLRVFVTKQNSSLKTSKNVDTLLKLERKHKLHLLSTYRQFSKRVEKNKHLLLNLLNALKKDNKKIVGYGAPAKGNTLLNYFGVTQKHLDYIVDDSPFKQGLYTPQAHIPVQTPMNLNKDVPDYVLILAWNFAESIIQKCGDLKKRGVKFIVPVPTPKIV